MKNLVIILVAGQLTACRAEPTPNSVADSQSPCDVPAARELVEDLVSRQKSVSLLAPDTVTRREIREAYGELVTPALLDEWLSGPDRAPGRQVSSPWPERVEIQSVEDRGPKECVVKGHVIYVTSAQLPGEAAARQPVTMTVSRNGDWRVSTYEAVDSIPADSGELSPDAQAAIDVLRDYYAAIGSREFTRAYGLWLDNGAASGQTPEEFAAGFEQTRAIALQLGVPTRVEGAAGSRYIQVPVTIRATTVSGDSQRFSGTYTLRRSVVDGATQEQRQWRIASADLAERQ